MTATAKATNIWAGLAAEPDYELWLPGPKRSRRPMLFRRIPTGSFVMGARGLSEREEPLHCVIIPREFWLGKFVVTQEEYAAVVRGLPALKELDPDPSNFKGGRRPVEQVSWDDATAWCEALRQWRDLPDDIRELRLPTEAEWEYACRAGTDTEYYHGDGEAALAEVGWFDGNSNSETHAVDGRINGRDEEQPAGLVAMHGNVWEWCRDVFDPRAYRKRPDEWEAREWTLADAGGDATTNFGDPIKPGEVPDRVLRGGSWSGTAGRCRSAFRDWFWPDDRLRYDGFRVCLVRGSAAGGGARERQSEAEASRATGVAGRGTRPETDDAGNAEADVDLATATFPAKRGERI